MSEDLKHSNATKHEISDEELEQISGGFIYKNKDGYWEVISHTGRVTAVCTSREDAVKTAAQFKQFDLELNDSALLGLRKLAEAYGV